MGRAVRWMGLVFGLACASASVSIAGSSLPVLLNEESGGVLELEDERKIELRGVHGTVSLRAGTSGELRYEARSLDNRREPRPVGLWLEGRTLRIQPLEGDESEPLLLELTLAPDLAADLQIADSRVMASGLHGSFSLDGEQVDLQARGLQGAARIEMTGGSADISGVGDLDFDGQELQLNLEYAGGAINLKLEGSSATVVQVEGDFQAELEGTTLTAADLAGRLVFEVSEGKLDLSMCSAGGELRLTDTPLGLHDSTGEYQVETNADVDFDGLDATLIIRGFGAAVRGEQSQGSVDVMTDGAEVKLDTFTGEAKIQGHELQVNVSQNKGTLNVKTSASEIDVNDVPGELSIENDFGDIRIRNVLHRVNVISREGDVSVTEASGPIELTADGQEVVVHWKALGSQEDSSVTNIGGDVRVSLPANARCRVDVEAPFGQVVTELDGLSLTDDGHYASGWLPTSVRPAPHVKRPTIRLESGNGDVYIDHSASSGR